MHEHTNDSELRSAPRLESTREGMDFGDDARGGEISS
jgi:hypothetical protein